jgi:hypothetical protein
MKSFFRPLLLMLLLSALLAACNQGGDDDPERVEQDAPPLPTVADVEDVGNEALGGAAETYEQTWANYLRDAIAEQVRDRQQKLSLLQRYEDPDITAQNLPGLVKDINLVEGGDRTTFEISNNETVASATADFDIELTYANGDEERRTCKPFVRMFKHIEDNKWYVEKPGALEVFAVCAP